MGVDKTSYGFFWIIFLPLPEMPECQPGQNEGGEEKSKWEQCGDLKPAFCSFSQCDPESQRIRAKSSDLQKSQASSQFIGQQVVVSAPNSMRKKHFEM